MTAVYAVLGRPIAHSLSPDLHGAWFAEHGLDAVYVALEVPRGREALVAAALRTLGLAGANLTAPLKEAVLPGLDGLEGDAVLARAANVLFLDDGRWIGANTDAEGFVLGLGLVGIAIPARAVVVGTGGAARAVALGLARHGTGRIAVLGRRPEAAAAVVATLSAHFPHVTFSHGPITPDGGAGTELVAVAISGHSEAMEGLARPLGPGVAWIDLAYGDPDRPGVTAARSAGCHVEDGLPMLVGQAALSFERWTGARPDPRSALDRLRARGLRHDPVPLPRRRC